ncbi:helix-turn-helix domain-containing protein [Endozoicomonas ascidiicola]|uniref:helix-turn-helix domain-containing protein n=1 Tax=Endozoicomonas ascidiicola TaxID=1698521 RepID=UPI0008371444|nr:helix-turn-helix domain-containing protein [Endozoicomonas ascidiicola]
MRVAAKISLSEQEQKLLKRLSSSNKSSVRIARRSKIILLAADGKTNLEIAEALNIERGQVSRWRVRYVAEGFRGIEKDLPRGGRNLCVRGEVPLTHFMPTKERRLKHGAF